MIGTVVEVNDKYVIIVTDDSDYVKLKYKSQVKIGQKIYYFEQDILRKKNYNGYLMIASLIILAVIIMNPLRFMNSVDITPSAVAIVSLDINPSVELELDEKLMVVDYQVFNNEGKSIVIEEMIIGKYVTIALKDLLAKSYDAHYLKDKDNTVLLTSTILEGHEDIQIKLDEQLSLFAMEKQKGEITFILSSATEKALIDSRKQGLSIGKHEILTTNELNYEEVADSSVKELYEKKAFESGQFQEIEQTIESPSDGVFYIVGGIECAPINLLKSLDIEISLDSETEQVTLLKDSKTVNLPYEYMIFFIEGETYFNVKDILDQFGINYEYNGSRIKIGDIELEYKGEGQIQSEDKVEEVIGDELEGTIYVVNGTELIDEKTIELLNLNMNIEPVIVSDMMLYDLKSLLASDNRNFKYTEKGFFIDGENQYFITEIVFLNEEIKEVEIDEPINEKDMKVIEDKIYVVYGSEYVNYETLKLMNIEANVEPLEIENLKLYDLKALLDDQNIAYKQTDKGFVIYSESTYIITESVELNKKETSNVVEHQVEDPKLDTQYEIYVYGGVEYIALNALEELNVAYVKDNQVFVDDKPYELKEASIELDELRLIDMKFVSDLLGWVYTYETNYFSVKRNDQWYRYEIKNISNEPKETEKTTESVTDPVYDSTIYVKGGVELISLDDLIANGAVKRENDQLIIGSELYKLKEISLELDNKLLVDMKFVSDLIGWKYTYENGYFSVYRDGKWHRYEVKEID